MSLSQSFLPAQPTSFIGRSAEIASIVELLENPECRLVTLTGPGGIGKTRLAMAAAGRFLQPLPEAGPGSFFPDGVVMIPLQAVNTADNIIPATAAALGFEFYEARDQDKQLLKHIGNRRLLLLVDNLEHLPQANEVLSALLAGAPGLKLLATSREPLNLPEEWLFHVEGMPFPAADETLGDYDAVRLFIERARRARYNFSIEDEPACVGRLCRLVNGLPLAIELAAAWLKRLSCQEIVAELEGNLDILKTNMRGVPDRQRSIRAVLDYSWQLLNEEERELFMKLSVFQGGFTREAAQDIAGATLERLAALVDKSLVAAQSNGRFQLHPLHRQYGRERLAVDLDMETAVRSRHCAWFAAFMDRPYQDYWGYQGKETLQDIDAHFDDVQAAWYWAVAQGRYSDLRRFLKGFLPYWYQRWHKGVLQAYEDGLNALRRAKPSPERDLALGSLLAFLSPIDLWLGDLKLAKARAEESIAILKPLNDRRELSHAYGAYARAVCWIPDRNPEQAETLALEAAALHEETGQPEWQGLMYSMIGYLKNDIGQYEASVQWFQKDLELPRGFDDPLGEARALANLGRHALMIGRYNEAGQLLHHGLEIARVLRNKSWINEAGNRLGLVAVAEGNLELAEGIFDACLAGARDWGKPFSIAYSLINLAIVAAAKKDYKRAAALYQESARYDQEVPMIRAVSLYGLGRIAFAERKFEQAQELHQHSLQISKENDFRLQMAQNQDALGRIALAGGRLLEARDYFTVALQEAVSMAVPPIALDFIASFAELLVIEGDKQEASDLLLLVLNDPLSTFESKERARILFTKLQPGFDLKTKDTVESVQVSQDWLSTAGRLLDQIAVTGDPVTTAAGQEKLLDPLSERELELLRLVSQGKSNREIAAELVLALGTVKSHLHNIFQKLDAGSRTQAILRAQELDLL